MAAAITLAGCGGSSAVTKTVTSTASATTTPQSSTNSAAGSPAAGAGRLNGKNGGFSTSVPHGWRDDAALAKTTVIDLQYVVAGPSTGGFLSNINVVREATSSSDVVAITHASIRVLHALYPSLHGMSAPRPLTVGGSSARGFNYLNKTGLGQHLHVQQIVVPHGGYTYTITYTALASGYARSLSALEQVVRGWRWQ